MRRRYSEPEMEFRVSVPGKIILHGEHSVVYGKTAIASAINLRTEATVKTTTGDSVVLHLKDFDTKLTWPLAQFKALESWKHVDENEIVKPSEELLTKIRAVFDVQPGTRWNGSLITFLFLYNGIAQSSRVAGKSRFIASEITISSALPIGAGLGSSAAYSVAIAASLLRVYGKLSKMDGVPAKEDLDLISKWAFQSEVILHGKPSGIDNSICTYGGALLYRKGHIQEMNAVIPVYRLLLVNTGVPRNTRALVERVRERVSRQPLIMGHVFDAMDLIARDCWLKLKEHITLSPDSPGLAADSPNLEQQLYDFAAEMITVNQHLLNSLGVGHSSLDKVVSMAGTNPMNYAAKMTGAGGGGCAFVLLGIGEAGPRDREAEEALTEALKKEGLRCWSIDMGCVGVTFD